MAHTTKDKDKLLARVRRIRGQIDAIERALKSEEECARRAAAHGRFARRAERPDGRSDRRARALSRVVAEECAEFAAG